MQNKQAAEQCSGRSAAAGACALDVVAGYQPLPDEAAVNPPPLPAASATAWGAACPPFFLWCFLTSLALAAAWPPRAGRWPTASCGARTCTAMRWSRAWSGEHALPLVGLRAGSGALCRLSQPAISFISSYVRHPTHHKIRSSHQPCHRMYAFDVHCNAFLPLILLLGAGQLALSPLLLRSGLAPRLLSCLLYAAAMSHYLYLTFLGYSALPFLERAEVREGVEDEGACQHRLRTDALLSPCCAPAAEADVAHICHPTGCASCYACWAQSYAASAWNLL